MPTKRYRLKLEHPQVEKGEVLNEAYRMRSLNGSIFLDTTHGVRIEFPYKTMDDWLEEVKEEVTFTKEQVETIVSRLNYFPPGAPSWNKSCIDLKLWLNQHTSKEE